MSRSLDVDKLHPWASLASQARSRSKAGPVVQLEHGFPPIRRFEYSARFTIFGWRDLAALHTMSKVRPTITACRGWLTCRCQGLEIPCGICNVAQGVHTRLIFATPCPRWGGFPHLSAPNGRELYKLARPLRPIIYSVARRRPMYTSPFLGHTPVG